jgi:hypothetical protein
MDPERHTCMWKNVPVALTVTEFLILQALASRPGIVKSRNALNSPSPRLPFSPSGFWLNPLLHAQTSPTAPQRLARWAA